MPAYVVVDASVAGAWLFPEAYSANAQPVLAAIDARRVIALAPDRFAEELLRVCQKKMLPPPDGAGVAPADAWERFLDVVTSPVEFLPSPELHERAWRLAVAARLTTHDALYLALAEGWGAELWTLDDLLAARGVLVYPGVRDLRTTAFPY
jgi:predicted nucleic acid-binding protein